MPHAYHQFPQTLTEVPPALADLLDHHEDWLVARILAHAKALGYTRYASTQLEAWRASICGLSSPLVAALRRGDPVAYSEADEDPETSPVAAFGLMEARKHRERGVTLPLFLGLMKHYKRAYHDLIRERGPSLPAFQENADLAFSCHAYVDRFFDRVELAFVSEWTRQDNSHQLEELRARNRALTNEKNKFLTMVESSPLPVLFLTVEGRIDHRNGAARRCFGEDGEATWPNADEITRLLAPNHPRKTDRFLPTPRGERAFVLRTLAMADVTGKFAGTLVICDDVTEERDVERRLRRSEKTLRSITDAATDGIVMIDDEGRIRFWNGAAATIFGHSEEEALGQRVHDLLTPDHLRPAAEAGFAAFLKGADGPVLGQVRELEALRADGTTLPIELSVGRVDMEGRHHAVGILRDISEKKEAQARLTQAQKAEALGNLAGGIAHDFNNMLLPIIGLTEMTRDDLPEDHPGRTRLGFVLDAAHRAADLVKRILAFSRKDTPERRPVPLGDILDAAEELLRSTLPSTVHLVTTFDRLGGRVLADPAQIQAVIMNLASNARDAMEGHPGTLTISLSDAAPPDGLAPAASPKQWLRLRVVDTGHGMDAETLARVFDPFFTTKDVGRGTGLGLSMVQGVVTAHGGVVDVESAPGQGSTFDVYLPRLPEDEPEEGESAA